MNSIHDDICLSRKGAPCNCPVPVPQTIGAEFDRDGRRWRVSVVVDTFIIGTAVDTVLDSHGEPSRDSDIIQVML